MMAPFCWKYKNTFKMLISEHRDGRLISKAVSHLSINTIQGSSNRNKISSTKKILDEINKLNVVGITPDGPKGPKQKVKEGIISMQKKTDTIIFPLSYSAKFKLSLIHGTILFLCCPNKIVSVWGNPIVYDRKKSLSNNILAVQEELDRVTKLSENLSK